MKRCPTCKRMFEDTLSFCLEDGTPLVPAGADSEATLVTPKSDLPPTQAYNPMPGGPASVSSPATISSNSVTTAKNLAMDFGGRCCLPARGCGHRGSRHHSAGHASFCERQSIAQSKSSRQSQPEAESEFFAHD